MRWRDTLLVFEQRELIFLKDVTSLSWKWKAVDKTGETLCWQFFRWGLTLRWTEWGFHRRGWKRSAADPNLRCVDSEMFTLKVSGLTQDPLNFIPLVGHSSVWQASVSTLGPTAVWSAHGWERWGGNDWLVCLLWHTSVISVRSSIGSSVNVTSKWFKSATRSLTRVKSTI